MAIQKLPFTHKRGDAFIASHDLKYANGAPLVTGVENLSAQFRDAEDNLLATAIIVPTDVPGTYFVVVYDTTAWVPGTWVFYDIENANNGLPSSTDTYKFKVEKDITLPEA